MDRSEIQEIDDALRELVKENDRLIYNFCYFMVRTEDDLEEVVLSIFRQFGEYCRKAKVGKSEELDKAELALVLFEIAWQEIKDFLVNQRYEVVAFGQVELPTFDSDKNLLEEAVVDTEEWIKNNSAWVARRIKNVDIEFRAPVVLRDLLGFDDKQTARILELRWGVYRQRLNRGRLELLIHLRGHQAIGLNPPKFNPTELNLST